jgi:deoxyribose-phosphate aldolase
MVLTAKQITAMMDLSVLRTDCTLKEVDEVVEVSKKYDVGCIIVWPSYVPYLKEKLADRPDIRLASVISFPGGASSTATKVFEAKELAKLGCVEIDMVINVGFIKSGKYAEALADVKAVVEAAGKVPVRVIMETHCLTDDEICKASELAVEAGAAFVKTGTGWNGAATVKQVERIYQTIGNAAFIKAAGGIRSLDAVKELYQAGCDRFGIGTGPACDILREVGYDSLVQ